MEESNLNLSLNSLSSSTTPTLKQSAGLENNDLYLNGLFGDNSSIVASDSSGVKTGPKFWKNTEASQNQNESEAEESVPHESKYSTSVQTFRKLKPPRSSKNPPLLYIKPEIKSIIDKIVFLRKCYISIQRHQSVFVSEEFSCRQRKLIREYQILIERENLRLYEMLRQYKLTLQDITSLIKCVNLRAFYEDQYEVHKKRFLLTQATRNAIKTDISNIKYSISDRFNDNGVRPSKNFPHYNDTEMSQKYLDKEWEIGSKRSDRQFKEEQRERIILVPENKPDVAAASKNGEKIVDKREIISKQNNEKSVKEREKSALFPGNKPEENLIISIKCDEKVTDKNKNRNRKGSNEKSKKEWERTVLVQENKASDKFVAEHDGKIVHAHFDVKADEVMKEHQETKKIEENVNDVKIDLSECSKKSKQKEKDTRKKFFSFCI